MIDIKADLCPKNHVCPEIAKCPEGAISQDSPNSAPKIDHDKCTECGLCSESCRVFVRSDDP